MRNEKLRLHLPLRFLRLGGLSFTNVVPSPSNRVSSKPNLDPNPGSRFDIRGGSTNRFRGKRRGGFTLLELILVIAILVVVAALSAPHVQNLFSGTALQKGADRVRIAMGQARVRAIRTGEEHAVYYTPQGAWFNVAPFSQFAQQAGLAGDAQQKIENRTRSNFEKDLLPIGVRFTSANANQNSRSAAVLGSSGGGSDSQIGMILFYPDGTSQDAVMLLQNERDLFIKLQLRGLTGIARTVRTDGGNDQ